jgi:MFS family permease
MTIENKTLANLISSAFFSNTADGIRFASFAIIAYELTHSAFLVSLISALGTFTFMIFTPFAGVIFDYVNRFRLMIWGDLIRMLAFALLAYLIFSKELTYSILLTGVIVISAFESFTDTGISAFIPQLIEDKRKYDRVNSIRTVALEMSNEMIGPALGGIIITINQGWTIVSLSLMYFVAGLLILNCWRIARKYNLPIEINKKKIWEIFKPGQIAYFQDMKDGVLTIWNILPVRVIFLGSIAMNLFAFLGFSTLVVYVTEVLDQPEWVYGLLWGFSAVGSILLGIVNAVKNNWIRTKPLIIFTFVELTITSFGLGLFPNFYLGLVLLFFNGMPMAVIGSRAWTIAQNSIDTDKLGRFVGIFAFFQIMSWGLSSLIGGVIAEFWGPAACFTASGIAVSVIVLCTIKWFLTTDIPFDKGTIDSD